MTTKLSATGERRPTISSVAVSLGWTRDQVIAAIKASGVKPSNGRIRREDVAAVVAAGNPTLGHP